jgi:hypothetical protein
MEEVQLLVLVTGLAGFIALYWGACAWTAALTEGKSVSEVARAFGFTLLPIAFGYFLAHFFIVFGPRFQELGRALLDPFGWSAPAEAAPVIPPPGADSTVWTAGVIWGCQMILIVAGHIFSVITAHRVVRGVLSRSKRFIVGQLPLLALMILYTWVSLWIASRPLLFKPLVPLMNELTATPN